MNNKLRCVVVAGLVIAAGVLSLSAQQSEGKKYAFLVGVRKYLPTELKDLQFSENDVTELEVLLKKAGYEDVVLMTHTKGALEPRYLPTADNIRRTLHGFLQVRKPGDTVLLAFAGHGVQFEKDAEPYFCPMDARLTKKDTLIALNAVYKELRDCPAAVKVLLVDACRKKPQSAPARERAEVELESVTRPQLVKPPRGTAAFFSCRAEQQAFESPTLKHGVFFYHVLEAFRGKAANDKGVVTIKALDSYLDRVTEAVQKEFGYDVIQQPTSLRDEVEGTVALVTVVPARITELARKPFSNSIGMKLVYIPPGKFTMGSPRSEKNRSDSEQQHEVEISRGFFMGAYEVTQGEYEKVIGKNPSWFSADSGGKQKVAGLNTARFPVEGVSWNDAVAFCKELSRKENKTYDLPSEAEWEYACRAGTETPFHFGQVLNGRQANCGGDYPYGTDVNGPSLGRTCEVGLYSANKFGLYDMHGNVWEWCKDWYARDYYANSPAKDPQGPADGQQRVLRGGTWNFFATNCRSASRFDLFLPAGRNNISGFRVVLRVP